MSPRLEPDGFELRPQLLARDQLDHLERMLHTRPRVAGVRIYNNKQLEDWLVDGPVGQVVRSVLGRNARPVRAIVFDKSAEANWTLTWHQDRTIALCKRENVPGFNNWTIKSGATHVEPPFSVIEKMLTARIHLDPVDETNAPLLVSPGSHRCGRIAEPEILKVVERCGTASCLASEGDVWLYSTAILHASDKSHGRSRRRVLQVDFSADELPHALEWLGVG